jgi:glycosyltransferase involved in cell wall biosynthesis
MQSMIDPLYRRPRAVPPAPAVEAPEFTILIPCYNEAEGIRETVETFRRMSGDHRVALLIVDDGSSDGTSEILTSLEEEQKDDLLQVVRHERNRGYGASLKTGLRLAPSELIVITDADGTYPNEAIPDLVRLARQADMVVGARTAPGCSYPWLRRIPKLFLRRWVSWISGRDVPDMNSGLRVFRKSIAERFLRVLPDGFSFTTTITVAMLCNRYDVRYVPIRCAARLGRSKIRPVQDTLRFCQLILRTGMYFAPLRLFSPLLALLALLLGAQLGSDLLTGGGLTAGSALLVILMFNTGLVALLADMVDKRSGG